MRCSWQRLQQRARPECRNRLTPTLEIQPPILSPLDPSDPPNKHCLDHPHRRRGGIAPHTETTRWVGFHPDPIRTRWNAGRRFQVEPVRSSVLRARPSFGVGLGLGIAIGMALALGKQNAKRPEVSACEDLPPRTIAWAERLSRHAIRCITLRPASLSRLFGTIGFARNAGWTRRQRGDFRPPDWTARLWERCPKEFAHAPRFEPVPWWPPVPYARHTSRCARTYTTPERTVSSATARPIQ